MKSQEWTAKPEEPLAIPSEYVTGLAYDIMILSSKNLKTFQCRSYELNGQTCKFLDVIMDTGERNARGKVTLQRVSYHPEVILANTGFMAIPLPSVSETPGG